jgi:predicted lipid carrier protein YhbT
MSRDRLRKHLRGRLRRRLVLRAVFAAMPRAVRRSALERENIVVEFRLLGSRDDRPDVRQLVIEDGAATVLPGEPREADLEITIDAADLLRVATGNAAAPALYVTGELEIYGDPWLAMRLPRLFVLGASRAASSP